MPTPLDVGLPLATGAVNLVGGLIGAKDKSKAQRRAVEQQKKNIQATLGRVQNLTQHPIDNPYDQIREDPRTRGVQMSAMQDLYNTYRQGGLTPVDQSRLASIRTQQNQDERGNREALMQQARMRGTLGGGDLLSAQLQSNQAAANRAAQGGIDTAALAQQQALAALQGSAQMAGGVRDQDYARASDRAAAEAAIQQFNRGLMQQKFANEMQLQGAKLGAYSDLTNLGLGGQLQGIQDRTALLSGTMGMLAPYAQNWISGGR